MPVVTIAKFCNWVELRLLQQLCPPVHPVARMSVYSQLVCMHTQIKYTELATQTCLGCQMQQDYPCRNHICLANCLEAEKPEGRHQVHLLWSHSSLAPLGSARDRILHLTDLFPPSMWHFPQQLEEISSSFLQRLERCPRNCAGSLPPARKSHSTYMCGAAPSAFLSKQPTAPSLPTALELGRHRHGEQGNKGAPLYSFPNAAANPEHKHCCSVRMDLQCQNK